MIKADKATSNGVVERLARLLEAQGWEQSAITMRALEAERDHWKNYAAMQSAVVCSGVVVPSDEYAALVAERDAAQAEAARLRGALEKIGSDEDNLMDNAAIARAAIAKEAGDAP